MICKIFLKNRVAYLLLENSRYKRVSTWVHTGAKFNMSVVSLLLKSLGFYQISGDNCCRHLVLASVFYYYSIPCEIMNFQMLPAYLLLYCFFFHNDDFLSLSLYTTFGLSYFSYRLLPFSWTAIRHLCCLPCHIHRFVHFKLGLEGRQ